MTLVIGLKAKDGIVLASDSKASGVLTSTDKVQKIFQLGDSSAVGISGDGGLATYFLDQVKDGLNYGTGILDLAEQIRISGKKKFNDYFEHQPPEERPLLSLILVGYSKEEEAEIFILESKDNFVPRKCVTGFECIGVPYIADYLLSSLYESDIKMEAGSEMCVLCIQETSLQNRSVGGDTTIATLDKIEKSFKQSTPAEIEKLKQKTKQFQLTQKSRFYPEEEDQDLDTNIREE